MKPNRMTTSQVSLKLFITVCFRFMIDITICLMWAKAPLCALKRKVQNIKHTPTQPNNLLIVDTSVYSIFTGSTYTTYHK